MFLRRISGVVFDPENGAGAGVAAPQTNGHGTNGTPQPTAQQIAAEEIARAAQQPAGQPTQTGGNVSTPAAPSLRDAYAARGYDMSGFDSDDALASHLDGLLTQGQQLQQMTGSWLPYADEINQLIASKGGQAQAPAKPAEPTTPEPPARRYQPPHELPENITQALVLDENTGLYSAPPNMPYLQQAARMANENQAYDQKFWGKFRSDPDAWLEESPVWSKREKALLERLEKVEAYYQQQMQAEAQTEGQAIAAKYNAVLFEQGADGQQKQTAIGMMVARYYEDQIAAGKPEREVLQAVDKMLQQFAPPPATPAQQTAAPATNPRGPDGRYVSPAAVQPPPAQPQPTWLGNGLKRLPTTTNRVVQQGGTAVTASENQLPQRPGLRGADAFRAIANDVAQEQGVTLH